MRRSISDEGRNVRRRERPGEEEGNSIRSPHEARLGSGRRVGVNTVAQVRQDPLPSGPSISQRLSLVGRVFRLIRPMSGAWSSGVSRDTGVVEVGVKQRTKCKCAGARGG